MTYVAKHDAVDGIAAARLPWAFNHNVYNVFLSKLSQPKNGFYLPPDVCAVYICTRVTYRETKN